MKPMLTCCVMVAACAFAPLAEDKGTCPLAPLHEKHRTNSADRSGKIQLLAVVSDTGYVCSAKVIDGIDKKSDADAENAVRQWHFVPAKKNGSPVPVVITVEVRFVQDKDGNVVLSSHQPAPTKDAPHH